MKTIHTDQCIRICDEKAVLEGSFSLPYDTSGNVLEIVGCAELREITAGAGSATLLGTARYTVLFCSKDGIFDSFDSECSFEHTVAHPALTPEARVTANAYLSETTWQTDGAQITLRSALSLDLTAVLPVTAEVVEIDRSEHFECDARRAPLVRASAKSIKAYADRAVRIPQTLPEVQKILLVHADAELNSLSKEKERIALEGEMHLNIIYESKDKTAPLQCFHASMPFGEIVNESACDETAQIFCALSAERITAELTAADTVSLAGVVSVNTLCIREQPEEVICDLYALDQIAQTERCDIPIGYPTMREHLRKTLRPDLEIPESAPAATRILYAAATPEFLNTVRENGQLAADGILHLTLIYATAEAGIRSIRLREPFELTGLPEADTIRGFCEYTNVQCSGRQLDLKIGISLTLCGAHTATVSAVRAVTLAARTEPLPCGMIVYYADADERIWEICKKFAVPQSAALPLGDGERFVLLR